VELETLSGRTKYRIVERKIVKPDAVSVLAPTSQPRLTLITCYPFTWVGPAPQRLVLIASPIGSTKTRQGL
ncbi:MAG TPA: sortase, partial [Thermoanaerobaculia bacterium]|nr:sortase [Thermoanaerobaculia bacterium]